MRNTGIDTDTERAEALDDSLIPMFVLLNAEPDFWITNCLGPSTAATIARKNRRVLGHWIAATGDDPDFVDWQGHEFQLDALTYSSRTRQPLDAAAHPGGKG